MNLRRNRIYELKDVFLLFGKNAPSFWHPLGSSNDCVAASEAMRFSVRSLGCALFYLGGKKMADTMGTKEASELWGYKPATISKWCREGLIPDASQDAPGSPWHIPKDAKCPKDKKGGKDAK